MAIIAVFGVGFVGSTIANYLEKQYHTVIRVDINLYPDTDPRKAINDCEGVVVCVPTPSNEDGTCDDSIVKTVLELAKNKQHILLKSTVTYDLMENYPDQVVYSPEFLRELTAEKDFANQKTLVFGAQHETYTEFWENVFSNLGCDIVRTNRTTASMIKYVHNAWLGTKVAFFHELFKVAPKDMNYSKVTSTLARMPNIGPSHMIVPNLDGNLGYGGSCFPKDIKALTNVLEHSILKQVNSTNRGLNETKV